MYFKVSVMILSAIFYGIGRDDETYKSIGQKDGIVYRAVQRVCDTRTQAPHLTSYNTGGNEVLDRVDPRNFLVG